MSLRGQHRLAAAITAALLVVGTPVLLSAAPAYAVDPEPIDGTWGIDGNVDGQLRHKLSESLWWVIVISERLGIDINEAYTETMDRIEVQIGPRA